MFIELIPKILSDNSAIIGKDRYLNSAVLIPVVLISGKENLLFEKRSNNVRQPGEVSFPGGHFEPVNDRNYLDTAIRETAEELGLANDKIKVLGKLGTLVTPMGIIVETFVGKLEISSIDSLNFDKSEVEKLFLVPLKFFYETEPLVFENRLEIHPFVQDKNGEIINLLPVKELGLPETYALPWRKGKHRVLVYKYEQEIIWGITAELIYEFVKRLKSLNEK